MPEEKSVKNGEESLQFEIITDKFSKEKEDLSRLVETTSQIPHKQENYWKSKTSRIKQKCIPSIKEW